MFGYDAKSAKKLLTDAGLVVTVQPSYTCLTQGRTVETVPGPLSQYQLGDPVTLFVTQPSPAAKCAFPAEDALAWRLLDFANQRGPAPAFASKVIVYVEGHQRTVLTGEEAADTSTWSFALDLLRQASRAAWVRTDSAGIVEASPPRLVVQSDAGRGPTSGFQCGRENIPKALADRPSVLVGLDLPADEYKICTAANLYLTDGRIDAMVVREQ